MLKKYLIQLEPSGFEDDTTVIDLNNLRKPFIVTATKDSQGYLWLEPDNQLNHLIKLHSKAGIRDCVDYLYQDEYTIIVEKEYVKKTTDPT